ncbi:hypothetical protein ACED51_14275 [Photobacterium swingsii]|uniref:hypothetical protein n=1 Tax=Photobacterium swingsii TaxID=680026 RepID=UPI00352E03F0
MRYRLSEEEKEFYIPEAIKRGITPTELIREVLLKFATEQQENTGDKSNTTQG